VLEFGEQRGRKSSVAAEFDQAHFSAEAKLSQLISDMIFVEGLLQMLGNHALQTFLRRGKKLGLFLKLTVSQGAQNDGRLFLAIKGC
jgi:hypothetical protein